MVSGIPGIRSNEPKRSNFLDLMAVVSRYPRNATLSALQMEPGSSERRKHICVGET